MSATPEAKVQVGKKIHYNCTLLHSVRNKLHIMIPVIDTANTSIFLLKNQYDCHIDIDVGVHVHWITCPIRAGLIFAGMKCRSTGRANKK